MQTLLSIDAPIADRVLYDFASVSHDDIHDALLDLAEYQQVGDIEEITAGMQALEEWQQLRIDGTPIDSPDHFNDVIGEYVEFFNDCVRTVESYHGSSMGTARAYSFHEHIAEGFEQRDEYRTALQNIADAVKNGESLDYVKSLLPDLGD